MTGVLSPVVTPFNEDLSPNADRLVEQCRWLLSQGVGLAVFGTNSEANSLSVGEKMSLLDSLVENGIDTTQLMPGTGCCAIPDTVELTRHALELGCAGTLMLPPFYYKGVSDDGLYRSYAEVIERVGDANLRVYLYHIPPVAHVGLSVALIERLVKNYPETVVGIKDSSGDWDNTASMLRAGWDDFRVFVGSETFLLQNMRAGGAGCISATANVNPAAIHALFERWREDTADDRQQELNDLRGLMMEYPMIPALKSTVAHFTGIADWELVRPPLMPLSAEQSSELAGRLAERRFTMPGLAQDQKDRGLVND